MKSFLFSLRVLFLLASVFVFRSNSSERSEESQLKRNINIQTPCGPTGTMGGNCPPDRGVCAINTLTSNLTAAQAFCLCKTGYYGENCQFGPLCNDTIECNGTGICVVQKYPNGTFVEKCEILAGNGGGNSGSNINLNGFLATGTSLTGGQIKIYGI